MEIKNYKHIAKGALLAKFDVVLPEWKMTLRGLSLFNKSGNQWIGMPGNSYKDKNGLSKHFSSVLFEKDTHERFEAACLEKIKTGQYEQYKNKSDIIDDVSIPF